MPPVRIEEIIQRLRRELAQEPRSDDRGRLVDAEALPAISARTELEYLNRNWQLFDPLSEMRSHRRVVGPIGLRFKWMFRRLVLGVLDRYFEKERLFLLELVRLQNAAAERSDRLLRELTERTKAVAERNDLFIGGLDIRVEALEGRERVRRELSGLEPASSQPSNDEETCAEMANAFGAGVADRLRSSVGRLKGAGQILVLGCGDGEVLAALAGADVTVMGIDASADLVAACWARGYSAERASLASHLEAVHQGSLGGLVLTRFGDRHSRAQWPRLVAAAWRSLRPKGVAVLEGITSRTDETRLRWLLSRQRFAIVDARDVPGPSESEREYLIIAIRSQAE